jgi:hypothetical protein
MSNGRQVQAYVVLVQRVRALNSNRMTRARWPVKAILRGRGVSCYRARVPCYDRKMRA